MEDQKLILNQILGEYKSNIKTVKEVMGLYESIIKYKDKLLESLESFNKMSGNSLFSQYELVKSFLRTRTLSKYSKSGKQSTYISNVMTGCLILVG